MRTAQDLLTELNASDESPRIEAKRAREIGKSIMETVIAYANEPGLGGGYLLLGVDWTVDANGDTRYWAVGIPDPDKAQRDLATQCASMLNVAVRPEMAVERVDGKTVLVIFVPEVAVDIRKPLMLALPQAEASVVDELPKGFRLPEGALQSRQEPVLSRKVLREALANAVMHRSYQDHSPIQIVRYSNRIEILNPGFSLKDMASLGTPGSRMRNPAIAAVLHEINWAETKGSGIRTMRRLAADAGLPLPEFASDRQKNEFRVTLFLHHLLTEEDYAWLKALAGDTLSADEAKALIYARETGVVDNTACRDFSGLDTLQASDLLRRLRDRGLLEKQGAGNRTHYTLVNPDEARDNHPEQGKLLFEGGKQVPEGGKQAGEGGKRHLPPLPPALKAKLPAPRQRMGEAALRQLIRDLCGWQALRGEELATLLGKDLKYLRNKHLSAMVQSGELAFQYPESPNHALQAYLPPKN